MRRILSVTREGLHAASVCVAARGTTADAFSITPDPVVLDLSLASEDANICRYLVDETSKNVTWLIAVSAEETKLQKQSALVGLLWG